MKQYHVVVTDPAMEDLRSISQYIAEELMEPDTAKSLIAQLKEAVASLSFMPGRNTLVSDERLAAQGIRKLLVGNYIIFYVVSDKDTFVTVLRFLYGRRDWEHLL